MDPEELVVCPYDPVHRVAAKKLPYHINKCRKHYDQHGEYKTCPFNARHIIPAPEFQYHMETCDAKGAIDMEIAFEQSKHEVSTTTKGCTDIPPMPNWQKPVQTENWDDDAPPVLRPQPLIYQPPANLPRPTPSRPATKFNSPGSTYSSRRSPNRYPSPFDRHQSPRGARSANSPRPPVNKTADSYHGDDFLIPNKKSPSTPEVDNEPVINQDEFPPLSSQTSPQKPIKTKENIKTPSYTPQQNVTSPQSQQSYQQSPNEHISQKSVTPQPTFSPIPLAQPLQPYHHQQLPQQIQPQQIQQQQQYIYNPPQQTPTIQYQTQTQPISYANPSVTVAPHPYHHSYPPQPVYYNPPLPVNDQVQYMPPAMHTAQLPPTYYRQQPQYYPTQPATPYYPPQHSYAPNPQPAYPYQYAPPPVSQMSVQRQNAPMLPPEQQPYIPSNPIPNQQMYNHVPTGVNPPSQYESSVVSSGQYGRGRGRGLYTSSSQKKDELDSFHSLSSQMQQFQIQSDVAQPADLPQNYTQHNNSEYNNLVKHTQTTNSVLPYPPSVQLSPQTTQQDDVPFHPSNLGDNSNTSPSTGVLNIQTKLNRVKISLASIALIEHKRELGTPLSKEEEDLLASKNSLLEKLK
eukprot:TRINITY_DN6161_c0_g1_i3.p1 TRINITY_DN6161_c0_g1~~TRINITY_DN6161_c0_g1_i3.p1  ORF type:complete len:627 (-),score=148.32 TRINITY_DN6161_c0_g1_i3:88-1968(-)